MSLPNISAQHDAAAVDKRRTQLQLVFAEMIRKPNTVRARCGELYSAVEWMHSANRDIFGWLDAELLRAQAMLGAMSETLPIPPPGPESTFGSLPL